MPSQNSCSIVIRCHNEEQHIGKLLTGIGQQTVKDVEVIVVDSGSTDATLAIASRYPVKIITIKPEEFSFGHSLNVGCAAASGEFIVIVSGHVYPLAKDWLEKMLLPFQDSNIVLVYGKQRGNDLTKYSEHQVFARWYPQKSNLHQSHPFCNNANASIRKETWERIHYNEELTGLEDLDFAKKAIDLGYHIAYIADATIIHVHDETPRRLYNRYRREAIALKKIFPEERFHFYDFFRIFFSNVLTDYYHAWHDGVLLKNLREIPEFRLMQFWGTYRGFAYQGTVASRLKQTFYYPNEMARRDHQPIEKDPKQIIDYSTHHTEVKS
jgi:glycosyltransferase involved in cell wall biosynthesis